MKKKLKNQEVSENHEKKRLKKQKLMNQQK